MTISAPYWNGFNKAGVATVLSTTTGTPYSWAIFEISSRSMIFPSGLPIDSTKTSLVLSSIKLRKLSGF
ncbi:Uncharacterised protein [Acinetobacter baumannii]|nr:Uncharacterised protein [Acinetobacter baumannii]